jgi:hypothetical protein
MKVVERNKLMSGVGSLKSPSTMSGEPSSGVKLFEGLSKGTWWVIDDNNVKLEWTSDSDRMEFKREDGQVRDGEKRKSPVRRNE